jgi:VWFA-related protein
MTIGTIRACVAIAGVAVAASMPAARVRAQAPQDAPVFRADVDAVTVDVSVRRGDRPVTGLAAGDFELTDNGVPQSVTALSYEKLPVDVTVLLDVSGSVTGAVLAQLRQAVVDLQARLEPQDRLRIVTFNMRVQRILDLAAPRGAAARVFASIAPGGSSAVIDAVAVALASPGAPDRRQFVVLFTDGKDSVSINTPSMLLATARRTSPTISIVLALPVRAAPDPMYVDLAAETGGTVVALLPKDSLGNSFRRALEQFRSSYVITFSPQGVPRTGSHALEVRVTRTGVEVRARRGYVLR